MPCSTTNAALTGSVVSVLKPGVPASDAVCLMQSACRLTPLDCGCAFQQPLTRVSRAVESESAWRVCPLFCQSDTAFYVRLTVRTPVLLFLQNCMPCCPLLCALCAHTPCENSIANCVCVLSALPKNLYALLRNVYALLFFRSTSTCAGTAFGCRAQCGRSCCEGEHPEFLFVGQARIRARAIVVQGAWA